MFSKTPGDAKESNAGTQLSSPDEVDSPCLFDEAVKRYKSYDCIIVGGGTAGAALANRLSANPGCSVLLVEAGYSDTKVLFSKIPATFPEVLNKPATDWMFVSTPQEHCGGRKMLQPRPKMLGGSSSANALIYSRPVASDLDIWAKNDPGWAMSNMHAYFEKSDAIWKHGFETQLSPLAEPFIQASVEVGIQRIADINTADGPLGTSRFPTNVHNGARQSTATSYLTPEVTSRRNLHLAVGMTVLECFFDSSESTPRAIGITFAKGPDHALFRAVAKREVLLCAGSINTPALLQRSGIGPKSLLEGLGIPIIADLPVGNNLADHLSYAMTWKAKSGSSFQHLLNPIKALPSLLKWLFTKSGPLTSNIGEAVTFLRGDNYQLNAQNGIDTRFEDRTSSKFAPSIEVIPYPVSVGPDATAIDPPPGDYLTLNAIHLRPTSKGTLQINDRSPWTKPDIDFNYLSDENDVKALLFAVKFCEKLAAAPALQTVLEKKMDGPGWPLPFNSDLAIINDIRERSQTLFHPVGTVKMATDSTGCVDGQLRVKGVRGLRVVDASVFPEIQSAHPCAMVVAMAERAADLISGKQ